MLDSINLEIYLSHLNLSQIKKKICKLKQFSNNSRQDSSILGSINLEIHSSAKMSQIKKKNLQSEKTTGVPTSYYSRYLINLD
jgi:hypothetical protein